MSVRFFEELVGKYVSLRMMGLPPAFSVHLSSNGEYVLLENGCFSLDKLTSDDRFLVLTPFFWQKSSVDRERPYNTWLRGIIFFNGKIGKLDIWIQENQVFFLDFRHKGV